MELWIGTNGGGAGVHMLRGGEIELLGFTRRSRGREGGRRCCMHALHA